MTSQRYLNKDEVIKFYCSIKQYHEDATIRSTFQSTAKLRLMVVTQVRILLYSEEPNFEMETQPDEQIRGKVSGQMALSAWPLMNCTHLIMQDYSQEACEGQVRLTFHDPKSNLATHKFIELPSHQDLKNFLTVQKELTINLQQVAVQEEETIFQKVWTYIVNYCFCGNIPVDYFEVRKSVQMVLDTYNLNGEKCALTVQKSVMASIQTDLRQSIKSLKDQIQKEQINTKELRKPKYGITDIIERNENSGQKTNDTNHLEGGLLSQTPSRILDDDASPKFPRKKQIEVSYRDTNFPTYGAENSQSRSQSLKKIKHEDANNLLKKMEAGSQDKYDLNNSKDINKQLIALRGKDDSEVKEYKYAKLELPKEKPPLAPKLQKSNTQYIQSKYLDKKNYLPDRARINEIIENKQKRKELDYATKSNNLTRISLFGGSVKSKNSSVKSKYMEDMHQKVAQRRNSLKRMDQAKAMIKKIKIGK